MVWIPLPSCSRSVAENDYGAETSIVYTQLTRGRDTSNLSQAQACFVWRSWSRRNVLARAIETKILITPSRLKFHQFQITQCLHSFLEHPFLFWQLLPVPCSFPIVFILIVNDAQIQNSGKNLKRVNIVCKTFLLEPGYIITFCRTQTPKECLTRWFNSSSGFEGS